MKCPRCQRENPPHAKFCLECATPLALRCWNCETQLPAGAMCFEYTGVRGPGRRPPPRFASLETYTPKHLAHRILTPKAALEGERKKVISSPIIATSVSASSTPERASTRQAHENLAAATTYREMDIVSGLSRKTEQDQTEVEG